MTITLKEDEYIVTKNGYLRRKDNLNRKVRESDVIGDKPEKAKKKKD